MTRLVTWWVKNPIAANLAMLALIVSGVISYLFGVEKEPFPITKTATMEVNMRWPGAGPRDIEDQIIVRFEDAVKNVEGIKSITSRALEGRASVVISGKSRVDKRKFAEDIREKINSVNGLPSDSERPVVTEKLKKQRVIRIALHGDMEMEFLNRLAQDIRRQVSALPLISHVQLTGEGHQEIAIEITEHALSIHEISIDEVASAIKRASVNASAGTVRDEAGVLKLSVRSRADHQQEFEDIVIRQTNSGATLLLKDIAVIKEGLADTRSRSKFDGEPAILIEVMNGDYMDIPKMSRYVHEYVEQKNKQLPQGVRLTIWSDWNEAYQSRLSTIFNSATSGLILVFIMLMLFLQPRVAMWVTAGIATAFAASFALLPSFEVSLNMLSLFAFLMVIGIVVDDAIVIGESIHLSHERGLHGDDAAINGVANVAKPVLFGVLTTIVVFTPMLFLPGSNAEFTKAIAVVVILSLLFSLFEALFILPSHLRHLRNRPLSAAPSRLAKLQANVASSIDYVNIHWYVPLLRLCAQYKYTVLLCFMGLFVVGLSLLNNNYINKSFLPQIADDKIRLSVTLPPSSTHDRMVQVLEQILDGNRRLVAEVTENGGKELIEHDYTRLYGTRVVSEIKLVAPEKRTLDIQQVANRLQRYVGDIPDAEEIEFKSTLNTQEPRIGFVFNSKDPQALREGLIEFKQHVSTYDGVILLRDNMDKGTQEMVFSLKPGVESMGLSVQEITKQVKQAYFGQEVQRLPKIGGDIRVKVLYSRQERESIESLRSLKIRTRDGRSIPLLNLVNVEIRAGIERIVRKDGSNVGYIFGEYVGNDKQAILDQIRRDYIPEWRKRHPQVNYGRGERMQEEDEFTQTVLILEGLALMVAYMLMAIAFRSYAQPLLILTAIPFGFLGALIGHVIHDISYGMFSMLGILAASGVVINDNLVLVDAINQFKQKGMPVKTAIIKACRYRFRPIILTSATTFIGLWPMLSADSVQAQFLIPMVVSLAYGVLAATVITLVFVPCLYLASANIRNVVDEFLTDRPVKKAAL